MIVHPWPVQTCSEMEMEMVTARRASWRTVRTSRRRRWASTSALIVSRAVLCNHIRIPSATGVSILGIPRSSIGPGHTLSSCGVRLQPQEPPSSMHWAVRIVP